MEPKEIDSFIYGVDDFKSWAYGKLSDIRPLMKTKSVIQDGVERRMWLNPDELGPITEGSLLVTQGMKVSLFDDGSVMTYYKEDRHDTRD